MEFADASKTKDIPSPDAEAPQPSRPHGAEYRRLPTVQCPEAAARGL